MEKIILIPNPYKDKGYRIARRVIYHLRQKGAEVYVSEEHKSLVWDEAQTYSTPPKDAALCIVMGGDGSVLDAAPLAIELNIPLLGVNLGRLGYLSTLEPDRLSLLDRLFNGKFKVKDNMLLSAAVHKANGNELKINRLSVNDIVICHDQNFGLADISLLDNAGNTINYRADGMIVATPAGSSAYSLSAGGPLVESGVDAFCVTPICSHSFFNRSILFSASTSITLKNNSERGQELALLIDGRICEKLLPGDEAQITVSKSKLKMIYFSDNGMLNTLWRKMEAAELNRE